MDIFKQIKDAVKAPKPSAEEQAFLGLAMVAVNAKHPEYNLGTLALESARLVSSFTAQWKKAKKDGESFNDFLAKLRKEQTESSPALKAKFECWKAQRKQS